MPSVESGVHGIKDVRRFRTKTGRYVDIVRSPSDTPVMPLHSFWSTLVCNFLTADGCGCGFPAGTVYRKGFVKDGPLSRRDMVAVTKYLRRGFRLWRDEWSAPLEMEEGPQCDADGFGDMDAMVVSFRLHVEANAAPLPVRHTAYGWRLVRPFPKP